MNNPQDENLRKKASNNSIFGGKNVVGLISLETPKG